MTIPGGQKASEKTWTQEPAPTMSEHSAHLTSLSIGHHMFVINFDAHFPHFS